jgi:hypothetical protein
VPHGSDKGEEKMKATIRELRSILHNHNQNASYALAPDWVILSLYERHCGLLVSRAGMPPMEKRSLAEIVHGKAPERSAVTGPAVSDEAERMKMRLQAIQ